MCLKDRMHSEIRRSFRAGGKTGIPGKKPHLPAAGQRAGDPVRGAAEGTFDFRRQTGNGGNA